MIAIFMELPPFEWHREDYLDDEAFRLLQGYMADNPDAGDLIPGTGGFRKLRWHDEVRRKGKRGGIRIIYYWYDRQRQFWLFTIYDIDDMSDLSPAQKKALRALLENEKAKRSQDYGQA